MELKMKEMQLPEKVSFNYEELKQAVAEKASFYANLVFTDEQLPEAKKTRADLNKLKKALNDERLKREKEYMQPFNEFKAQINEIISLIDEPVKAIDSQIKGFEEQQKEEKLEKIKELWNNGVDYQDKPEWLTFEHIFKITWLNKSVSMKSIDGEMYSKLSQIEKDIVTLEALPEFSFEAVEMYKQTLDINMAISEGKRLADIQKRKLEAEQHKPVPEPEPTISGIETVEPVEEVVVAKNATVKKAWVKFEALLSAEEGSALRQFFEDRCIEYKAI